MSDPEVWLRGPVADVPALLQPVAHALLQARDEVEAAAAHLPADALWVRPAGLASAGFHLRHLAGVLDRMLTYARGEPLSDDQLRALEREGVPADLSPAELSDAFALGVDAALAQLRTTDATTLTDVRAVGRERVPSTHVGLLVHAAEHTMRHVGQLIVTARVVAAASR